MYAVKVLIVDDHPIVLSGCRALLAEAADMVMLEARNATAAQEVYALEQPDVTVIDINLPDISGFELARRLLVRDPERAHPDVQHERRPDVRRAGHRVRRHGLCQQERRSLRLPRPPSARSTRGGHSLPTDMAQKIAFLRIGAESPVHV